MRIFELTFFRRFALDFRLCAYCVLCAMFLLCADYREVDAHGSDKSSHVDEKDLPAIDFSASGASQPFPANQVENNVAVEFKYKLLPKERAGFENELSKLISSFKTQGNQGGVGKNEAGANSGLFKNKQSNSSPLPVPAGQDVALIFKVSDATMNWPIQGQGYVPDTPIRFAPDKGNINYSKRQIIKRAKIYGGHFPMDEYTYFFVLNSSDGTVSVVDASSLYTGTPIAILPLCKKHKNCKGIDIDLEWLGRYAYVTLDCDAVAVIDCMRLEVVDRIKVGSKPFHVFVQPDGKFAWVCNDGDATVTIIDAVERKVVKVASVGKGHHEIAFSGDSRYACVTNQGDDNVSIIDVYTLSVVGNIKVGKQPHGVGFSKLSGFMYVANEGSGTVSVVDPKSLSMVNTIKAGKGVRTVKFGPDPRWGFAPNKQDDTCSMIDVTRDFVYETLETGTEPDDVTFVPGWVFIRSYGSADLTTVSIRNLDLKATVPLGYKKPSDADLPMGHISIVTHGDGHSVLAPSPVGRAVYRYAPGGDAAAGGTVPTQAFNTQANGASDLAVYYRGLKEVSSGVYLRVARFHQAGRYEIAFYIDNPELTACFELQVVE